MYLHMYNTHTHANIHVYTYVFHALCRLQAHSFLKQKTQAWTEIRDIDQSGHLSMAKSTTDVKQPSPCSTSKPRPTEVEGKTTDNIL